MGAFSYNLWSECHLLCIKVEIHIIATFTLMLHIRISILSFTDIIETTVDMYSSVENLIVGAPYEIQCDIYTDQEIHPEIINITWIGPNNDTSMTDNRMKILPTISDGNIYTSILHFLYLSNEDEGLYICNVEILDNTSSASFELKEIISKFICLQPIPVTIKV